MRRTGMRRYAVMEAASYFRHRGLVDSRDSVSGKMTWEQSDHATPGIFNSLERAWRRCDE
jgi:hypothetical protein